MIESFALSIFFVLMILLWLLRIENKLTYFLPLALSSLMGPLAILSLISLFQIPVTIVTSIFLAVMVGLAGDNAIQFLFGSEGDLSSGVQGKASSSIVVTILMMAGSLMFLFQSLLPMKIIGGLFILGFLINLVGDLWGLKRLLK
jgi:predicted RND superfamily exporter protein